MKKVTICFITIILLATFISATAEQYTFSLRNGITWGMTKDEVIAAIKSEPESSEYIFANMNYSDFFQIPSEHADKAWIIPVIGITFGETNDEQVYLLCIGTNKEGLLIMTYGILFHDVDNDTIYKRMLELKSQLEKKYDIAFDISLNKWEKNTTANYDQVFIGTATLPDSTEIQIGIQKESGVYGDCIIYSCGNADEISNAISDGSYFVEVPFGL